MKYFYLKITVIAITFFFFVMIYIAYRNKFLDLKGYDTVGAPEEDVLLKCKLQTSNVLGFDKSGELVDFFLDGKLIGSALTDKDGFAEIKYSFDKYQLYTVKVKLNNKSKYLAKPGRIVVGVFEKTKPIIICDIDHTVCDTKLLLFIFKKDKRIPVVKGSSESLNKIIKKYNVIYVTHRDDAFMQRTKYWLDMFNYPLGPVFFWRFGGLPFSNEKYKQLVVNTLKKRFDNIVAGIGDKTGDAMAYFSNGLKAILLTKRKKDLPDKILQAKDWNEIEAYLLNTVNGEQST